MRDQTALDERLNRDRAALLADIAQPPMARVGARAAVLRRRRRARDGAVALALVVTAALLVRPDDGRAPQVAEPPRQGPVYAADGITINGLPDPATALDLPGTVTDVEFADPGHGYAVTSCADPGDGCRPAFAYTVDGGHTWTRSPLPDTVAAGDRPDLVAFGRDRLILRAGDRAYASSDGGRRWRDAVVGDRPTPARPGDVLRLRAGGSVGGAADCAGGRVEVWTPDAAPQGPLPRQPELDVCWVAATATATGAWWVGGAWQGRAAVAVSHDDGRTWKRVLLPADGAARVAVLGRHAYAVVTDGDARIRAVLHSTDRGTAFSPVPPAGALPSLVGEPVPLLDGRLLLADPARHWQVSDDDGATFRRAEGTLPVVGGLARTPAGYLAYDLFGGGWTAFSTDGTTWRKLDLR